MSAPLDPRSDDGVHPLARPFLWLDKPWARRAPLYVFGALSVLWLLIEFFAPRLAGGKYPEVLGVYEIEAFVGFCLAVMAGWVLRWLLGREPDYYDQERDDV